MPLRRHALLLAAAFVLVAPAAFAATDMALKAAIASPTRPAGDVARDGARHPYDSLVFWGLKPGQTVFCPR